jgi:hypothetical protein
VSVEHTARFTGRTKSLITTMSRTLDITVGQVGIVVGESGPKTMLEFVDATSLKRNLLGEFQSLCVALRSPAKRTGVIPLIHSNSSASTRDRSGDR